MFNLFTAGEIGSPMEFKSKHIDLVKITRENPENIKDIKIRKIRIHKYLSKIAHVALN